MLRHVKKVFYFEVLLNAVTLLVIAAAPRVFLQGLGVTDPSSILITMVWFFGSVLLALTVILARTLQANSSEALRFVLEGYLVGDIVYIAAQVALVTALGNQWAGGSIFGVAITIVLATARLIYLSRRSQGLPTE